MKLIVLCLCACVSTVVGQNADSMKNMPKYDARYDYLDVDALFNSKRLVRNYVDCLINGFRCTPEGKVLKSLLPEALRSKCVRCSERQKRTAVKIIRRLKNEYPEEWAKLAAKWDPTGDFTRYFEVSLANENFNAIPNNGVDLPAPTLAPPMLTTTEPPVAATSPSAASPGAASPGATPPRPVILNRFGDEGELMMGSPSSAVSTPRTTTRPATTTPSRPTPMSWDAAASNSKPTRLPQPPTEFLAFTTAATIIDHIGVKIMRTTELITDILKNTVRAVMGR